MVDTAANIWRDFVTDGVSSTGANKPAKADIREWGTYLEGLAVLAFTSSLVYSTRAALYANLVPAANVPALVIGDPTAGYDGLYQKVGATTTGSWTQLLDFIPGTQFVSASDTGAGTANAIEATTDLPVSSGGNQLISLAAFEANTTEAVTIEFNGSGTTYGVKDRYGNNFPVGGVAAGAMMIGRISGSTIRFYTDGDVAAIAAQVAADRVAVAADRVLVEAALASVGDPLQTLTATTNYYVNDATGNDTTGDGSSGTPWATLQKAFNILSGVHTGGQTVNINVADATYTAGLNISEFSGWVGPGVVNLIGNVATPDNCHINTSGSCIEIYAPVTLRIKGFKLSSSGSNGIVSQNRARVLITDLMHFGDVAVNCLYATRGGYLQVSADVRLTGTSYTYIIQSSHGGVFRADTSAVIYVDTALSLGASSPTVGYFALSDYGDLVFTGGASVAGAGSVTGQRYYEEHKGMIQCSGSNPPAPTFFPGTIDGVSEAIFNGGTVRGGILTPADISADVNDWNPSTTARSYEHASIIRMTATGSSRNITGLTAGSIVDSQEFTLVNIGAQNIVLKNSSASSAAGNRFLFDADVTLAFGQSQRIWYDSINAKWRKS